MKKFIQFVEDAGAVVGGPTTTTSGVSGAGDNPDVTVPVFRKKKMPLIKRTPNV